jgi:hypothetical protein
MNTATSTIKLVSAKGAGNPNIKDGVLSAFEHHCVGGYNLPFTGMTLIPSVKIY